MENKDFNLMPGTGTFSDIPADRLGHMAVRFYLLATLAWDYTDTVLDMAVQMKIPATRSVTRAIRQIRLDYDRQRARDLDRKHLEKETELAELFEAINMGHIRKLCMGLRNDTLRDGLDDANAMLVEAVQMAMTVIDAMRLYASECDAYIRRYYRPAHSFMPVHFTRLQTLLPQYAGDCYRPDIEARRLTAGILLNELKSIELYGN